MSLKDQINADFIAAFKAGAEGKSKKNFLGVLKGEIQLAESKPDFKGDETVLAIVKKMEKSLKENANTGDEQAKVELEYLQPYLPKLMEREAIVEIVTGLVELGADNIGKVMREFNTNYKGQADNNIVKEVAGEILG